MNDALPPAATVLAVCAHPDDESFGLGAVMSHLSDLGTSLAVLCFTHGEASTLRGVEGDLSVIRAAELHDAGEHLGVGRLELLDYPDGDLASVPSDDLVAHVLRVAAEVRPGWLLAFDDGGITGHPDHQAATDAAISAARTLGVPVLAWAIPSAVADTLNAEFGTTFVGRDDDECDIVLAVDRRVQLHAVECHTSQATDNPVMRRRLELLADKEYIRVLGDRFDT